MSSVDKAAHPEWNNSCSLSRCYSFQVLFFPGVILSRCYSFQVLFFPGVILSRYYSFQVLFFLGVILSAICTPLFHSGGFCLPSSSSGYESTLSSRPIDSVMYSFRHCNVCHSSVWHSTFLIGLLNSFIKQSSHCQANTERQANKMTVILTPLA